MNIVCLFSSIISGVKSISAAGWMHIKWGHSDFLHEIKFLSNNTASFVLVIWMGVFLRNFPGVANAEIRRACVWECFSATYTDESGGEVLLRREMGSEVSKGGLHCSLWRDLKRSD